MPRLLMLMQRCAWPNSELMLRYHDEEWGVPIHDDHKWYEHLILDGAQAGLSWSTILNKREGYRRAFAGFDPARVARFTEKRIEKLLQDPGIVRNRQKVRSAVNNARRFLEIQEEFDSFNAYIWRFTNGRTIHNSWKSLAELPATSPESDALSRDLKSRGFSFVGSTICYAMMQASGMFNDHLVKCFRHAELRDGCG